MQLEPMQPSETVPRRVVASYPTYEAAEAAVERLALDDFPVEHLAIVGSDLRLVEQVTGRIDAATATLLGAATGAAVGVTLALLSSVFVPGAAVLALVAFWFVGGAIAGALIGLVASARARGQRDFSSVSHMDAASYDLMSTEDLAHEALSRLSQNGTAPAATWPTNARQ